MTGPITLSEAERISKAQALREIYDHMICYDPVSAHRLSNIAAFIERDQPQPAQAFCEWTLDGAWIRSPHNRMITMAYGLRAKSQKFCQDCGKPVREKEGV